MKVEFNTSRRKHGVRGRISQMVIAFSLAICAVASAIGANFAFASLAGLTVEECAQVTCSESALRHAQTRCSFVEYSSAKHRHGELASSELASARRRNYTLRLPVVLLSTHLLGAGVQLRC
jgi:hypothetical protein